MKVLARHLTVDMYNCKLGPLSNLSFLREKLAAAIEASGLIFLDANIQTLENNQLTALILLHEGHLTVHTYPALHYAAVDIYTCGENCHPEKTIAALRSFLKPEKTKTTYLKRGDFGAIKDMKPRIKVSVAPFRRIRNTGARMFKMFYRRKLR